MVGFLKSSNRVNLHFFDAEKKLLGFTYSADKPKTHWIDERFADYQRRLDKRYPNHVNQIFDWTSDAKKLLVTSWNAKSPRKVFVFVPDDNRIIMQSNPAETLDQYLLGDKEIFTYPSQDGTNIRAYLTLPAHTDSKSLPLIVMPHGGPFVRSEYDYNEVSQYFASRGYAVLEPNYRGSVGLGRAHLIAGQQGIADIMLSDSADGARTLIQQGRVDPSQVYIFGFSYGGYAAIMSGIQHADIYSAAVSFSAPLDLEKQLKYHKKEDHWFAHEFWQEVVGLKVKGKNYVKSISPLHRLADIEIPLLVFHGELDSTIPKEQAEDFKEAVEAKKLDIPVRILKSEGHSPYLVSSKVYLVEKTLEHFQQYRKKPSI